LNEKHFRIVILYHAAENDYSISAHNQTAEEAQKLLDDYQQHLKPGFSFVLLDQERTHTSPDAATCRACRETVRRSSGITPRPTFRRRRNHDR
jgi:hypothetical protein